MATIYRKAKGARGSNLEENIALMPGVQEELRKLAFEVTVRAETLLIGHKSHDEFGEVMAGDSEILMLHGDIDYYVVLSDDRGQKAALSIEYGREAPTDDDGNPYLTKDGDPIKGMEGLFILHRAAGVTKRRKGKVRF